MQSKNLCLHIQVHVHTNVHIIRVCTLFFWFLYLISANLPMPYLNGVSYCDPLGDLNVWGTMLKLPDTVPEIIMLATKVGRCMLISCEGDDTCIKSIYALRVCCTYSTCTCTCTWHCMCTCMYTSMYIPVHVCHNRAEIPHYIPSINLLFCDYEVIMRRCTCTLYNIHVCACGKYLQYIRTCTCTCVRVHAASGCGLRVISGYKYLTITCMHIIKR